MITPEIAANREYWLAALESGRYQQCRHRLRDVDTFCCLGVAEDVRGATWALSWNSSASPQQGVATYTDEGQFFGYEYHTLTREAQRWLGLTSSSPSVCVKGQAGEWFTTALTALNDQEVPFPEVARIIRDQGDDWDGSYNHAIKLALKRNNQRRSDALEGAD